MPHLKLPDASIYYEEFGNGPCVVFVHGSGGNHLSWWQQVPELSKHHRCVVLDLRGFGLSRSSETIHDTAVVSDDVRLLLDHMGVERAHLVGQSVGGHYALRFCLANPQRVRSLVLADTLAGIEAPQIASASAAAGPVPETLLERALWERFRAENPALRFLYECIERLNRANGNLKVPIPSGIESTMLTHFETPTLFIVGEHDPVAPVGAVEIAAELIPHATLKIIPNCGHSAYFEEPHAFNRALLDFFSAEVAS